MRGGGPHASTRLQFVHQLTADLPCQTPVALLSFCRLVFAPEYSMRFKSLFGHSRASILGLTLATAVLLVPAAVLAEVTSDPISVNVDQAKLVKLPAHIATIVVGNPLIADVTLQPGGLVV